MLRRRVAITTGDTDGVGLEVSVKALARVGPQRRHQFYLFRSASAKEQVFRKLIGHFKRKQFQSWSEALSYTPRSHRELIEIVSNSSPAHWVETAATACQLGTIHAMVTAPLSKQEIKRAGLLDLGHTDILRRITGSKNAFMGFVGEKFSVVLATGHIPVSQIHQVLSVDLLIKAGNAAEELRIQLPKTKRGRPIGILGLNPHAGDQGLIGNEDSVIIGQAVLELKKLGIDVVGPLVPDSAFERSNWPKYSVYIACYHDQGLIPFKAIHGFDSGLHLTLGLPLKRTSVDHGTAKDIFGKNRAKAGSMVSAIRWVIQ